MMHGQKNIKETRALVCICVISSVTALQVAVRPYVLQYPIVKLIVFQLLLNIMALYVA